MAPHSAGQDGKLKISVQEGDGVAYCIPIGDFSDSVSYCAEDRVRGDNCTKSRDAEAARWISEAMAGSQPESETNFEFQLTYVTRSTHHKVKADKARFNWTCH